MPPSARPPDFEEDRLVTRAGAGQMDAAASNLNCPLLDTLRRRNGAGDCPWHTAGHDDQMIGMVTVSVRER